MSNLTDVTQRQILRGLILQICVETASVGASVKLITAALKRIEIVVTEQEVSEACRYLEGKGLIRTSVIENNILNIKRMVVSITPLGIDVLEGTTAVEGVELS